MVYRALVRAKVAAIRYSQTETNEVSHATAEEEITLLVKLARRFVHACDVQPRLWITHGVSGSGKTTGSEKILQRHGAIRIRADVERKRLLGMKPLDRVSEDDERAVVLYSEEMSTRTYQRLRDLTEEMIQGGTSVIVDATFLEKRRRSLFKSLADSLQVPFQILAFHAQPDALHQRVADRLVSNRDASDANLSVLASQMRTYQQLDDDELPYTIPYVDSP
jgi:predicted kinase